MILVWFYVLLLQSFVLCRALAMTGLYLVQHPANYRPRASFSHTAFSAEGVRTGESAHGSQHLIHGAQDVLAVTLLLFPVSEEDNQGRHDGGHHPRNGERKPQDQQDGETL